MSEFLFIYSMISHGILGEKYCTRVILM